MFSIGYIWFMSLVSSFNFILLQGGMDDGYYRKLHPARWRRIPHGPAKKWWAQVPVNRDEEGICLDLPLEYVGMQNLVAPKTIAYMHERTYPVKLKNLLSENVNISSKPRKKIERLEEGEITNITDFWWADVASLFAAQEAVLNYCGVLQIMWPVDATGSMLMRVFTKFRWISSTSDESMRVAIVTLFFNAVMLENAQRAAKKKPPMCCDDQEKLLKWTMRQSGVKVDDPVFNTSKTESWTQPGSRASNNSWNVKDNRNTGGQSGGNNQSGAKKVREFAKLNGMGTCYKFNSPQGDTCKNKKSAGDCEDPTGAKKFAHVCNRCVASMNSFCLGRHPRRDHR